MPKVRAKNTRAAIRRLWGYLKRQRAALAGVIALVLLGLALSLAGPYLIGTAIDRYIALRDPNGLLQLCVLLLAVYIGGSVVSWLQTYVMSGIAGRTVWELRRDLFAHMQELPVRFFDKTSHGELMSRTTNDIDNVSNTLNQSLLQLITSVVTLIGSLTMMLLLNGWLTLVALVIIPLVTGVARQIGKRTKSQFKEQQRHLGALNGFIEETISGQKVVKIYNREELAAQQFQEINAKLRQAGTRAQIFSGMMGPFMNLLNHTSFILLAVAGGWMAYNGWTTIGVIVSFLNYSKQFSGPVNELANQYNMIQSGVAGAERVFEILDTDTEFGNEGSRKPQEAIRGEVEFDRVTFGYGDTPVLREVSFAAQPGQVVALVGPTGSGKTTIINLLTRFYEISEGTIRIDGKDIGEWDKSSLRSRLGMVLQDAHLFSGTIRDNIRYGRLDATEEELRSAAKLANADGFIRKLPQGYDTPLSAEGGNLSHGQRQLLTIARAILSDPSILILDEATSSVDTRTEMHIQEAMKALMQGRTSFVIAHRISTIQEADLILVVRGGEIVERGTHEQLLALRGLYAEMHANPSADAG
ncbi:multidrug ABC transporter ATP-binding protein [Paenibacillus elgii]|uniref:Multidrug ABC transporter ATP-binding protein n=1 Tax=Paenibacillus elgii TaxID=189691 RepID=A0A163YHU6_9BACL|nr:ABC transporter ATP-binding protein [Paenibacillus elgii]KZE79453.1 multidrug ABC transporter ATP-binding protein [Paenibacillus elgii]